MNSPRKAEANRRNARRSTGPVSRAGKLSVSGNARKHGLSSSVSGRDGLWQNGIEGISERLSGCRLVRAYAIEVIVAICSGSAASEQNLEDVVRKLELAVRYERDIVRHRSRSTGDHRSRSLDTSVSKYEPDEHA